MTWGSITHAEWRRLEPYLPVRMAYVIGRMRGFIGTKASAACVEREIGADPAASLRRADATIEKARMSRQKLRPDMCWPDMREKAALKVPFLVRLADHGLVPADVRLLRDDEGSLIRFAQARLAGASQAAASRTAGWCTNHGLGDVLVNKLRARKYKGSFMEDAWTPRREIVRKWTRGATTGYGRLKKGYGGYVLNKLGLDTKEPWRRRDVKIGAASAVRTCADMLQLSCRMASLFWAAVMAREVLELSELGPEEHELAMKKIMLVDWRILRSERREWVVRMYWRVPLGVGDHAARSTVSGDFLASSFDLPLDRV